MSREKVFLICSECLNRNYSVSHRKDDPNRVDLRKFCPRCNKHTIHKQSK